MIPGSGRADGFLGDAARVFARPKRACKRIALMGLLAGMRQKPAGVELFDWDATAAVGEKIHGVTPDGMGLKIQAPHRLSPARRQIDPFSSKKPHHEQQPYEAACHHAQTR